MSERKKILVMGNGERGQANVLMAVTHELLLRPEFEVHVASFYDLKTRFNDEVSKTNSSHATFHTLPSPGMVEALWRNRGEDMNLVMHAPSLEGCLESYEKIPNICVSWNQDEYLSVYHFIKDLLKTLDPAVVVIDPLFSQGIDACEVMKREYLILTPVSLQHTIKQAQGKSAMFLKYPS